MGELVFDPDPDPLSQILVPVLTPLGLIQKQVWVIFFLFECTQGWKCYMADVTDVVNLMSGQEPSPAHYTLVLF